jgi:hypothetical protein
MAELQSKQSENRSNSMSAVVVEYMIWFGVVIASLVVAGIHLFRWRLKGLGLAIAAPFGALLSWMLLSAHIGALEINGYAGSPPFVISIFVGILGISLFAFSCLALNRRGAVGAKADRRC